MKRGERIKNFSIDQYLLAYERIFVTSIYFIVTALNFTFLSLTSHYSSNHDIARDYSVLWTTSG